MHNIYGIVFFIFHLSIEVISYMLLYLRFGTSVSAYIILIYDTYEKLKTIMQKELHYHHNKSLKHNQKDLLNA